MAGIYIHIPFCKQACHYCDFHFSTSLKYKDQLLHSLCKELVLRKKEIPQTIETIYFGGGTPSLLTSEEIQLLIKTIEENYQVSNTPEITLEANPDDLSKTKLKELAKTKINRLSIGVQSFFEEDLQLMNRAHNQKEALDCIKEAQDFFDNITIDLIYGIPGMNLKRWQKNLEIAMQLKVPHISTYALTVEPKTALKKMIENQKIASLDDALAKKQYALMVDFLEAKDFVNYEFSNFGKEDYFSKNNTAYWQGKSYLGIGPSAHSFNGKQRSWNVSNNIKYIKNISENILPSECETLTVTDRYNEYIMTGLRTMWGVSLQKIEEDFGKNYVDYLLIQAEQFLKEGLLKLVFARSEERVTKQPQKVSLKQKKETKLSLINEITSSSRSFGTPSNDRILKITKKGKFLGDGISSQLFKID